MTKIQLLKYEKSQILAFSMTTIQWNFVVGISWVINLGVGEDIILKVDSYTSLNYPSNIKV